MANECGFTLVEGLSHYLAPKMLKAMPIIGYGELSYGVVVG